MRALALLLAVAAVAPLLAGCAGPPGARGPDDLALPGGSGGLPGQPKPVLLAPHELEAGHYYAFRHTGGDLSLDVARSAGNGSADLVLFDGDDGRIGRIRLGGDGALSPFVVEGVDAGELVVLVAELEGRLDLRSGGSSVARFERLASHVERHVLMQRPYSLTGGLGLPPLEPQPAEERVDLSLLRAPSTLRLWLHGHVQGLAVHLSGSRGPVLEATYDEPFGAFAPGLVLYVDGELHEQNLRDGRLTGQATARHFEGVLLLEAESFSRARPAASGGAATDERVRFTYGALPDQPVAFQVHGSATRLFVFQERPAEAEEACDEAREDGDEDDVAAACEGPEALVALFGPKDERVATLRVPHNRTMAVPVHAAGEWVAVLLEGQASLGADRAPADFELHPLDVRTVVGPDSHAAQQPGEYGQASQAMAPQGVAFGLRLGYDEPGGLRDLASLFGARCGPGTLRAVQDGETIGAWGYALGTSDDSAAEASLLLDGGPLTLVHDDYGSDCPRRLLHLDGYER